MNNLTVFQWKNIKNKKEVLWAFSLQLIGWIILFFLSWKITVAITIIFFGQRIERDLVINTIIDTIENILSSLTSLTQRENFLTQRGNPINKNGEIKKN